MAEFLDPKGLQHYADGEQYRVPVLYLLMRRFDQAERVLRWSLALHEGKSYPAAENYHRFAEAFQFRLRAARTAT